MARKYSTVEGVIDYVTGRKAKLVVKNSFIGIVFAIGTSLISGVIEVADLFINPLNALGKALEDVVRAFFIQPLNILIQAATTSAASLEVGASFDLGPFTVFVGAGVVLGLYYLVTTFLNEQETSNAIPGAPFDIPIPGFRDEEDTADE